MRHASKCSLCNSNLHFFCQDREEKNMKISKIDIYFYYVCFSTSNWCWRHRNVSRYIRTKLNFNFLLEAYIERWLDTIKLWIIELKVFVELECHIKLCFHVLICVQVVDSALSYSTWHSWHHIALVGGKKWIFLSYTAEIICQCIVPLNDINELKQVLTGFCFPFYVFFIFLYPQEIFWQQKWAYKFHLNHQLDY